MELNFLKARKGQVSIEFILLLVIMLLYIILIILPTLDAASQVSEDVIRLGEARLAGEKLADAINYVALSDSDARQVVTIFVPAHAFVFCAHNSKVIQVAVRLSKVSDLPADCVLAGTPPNTYWHCIKNIPLINSVNLADAGFCDTSPIMPINNLNSNTAVMQTVRITKDGSGNVTVS